MLNLISNKMKTHDFFYQNKIILPPKPFAYTLHRKWKFLRIIISDIRLRINKYDMKFIIEISHKMHK